MSHPSTPGPAPTAQAGSTPSILLQPLPPSAPSPPASVPPATPRITSSGTPPIDFSGLINGGIFGASVTFGAFAQVAATGSEPVLSLTFIAWAFAAFTLSFVLALWYGTLLNSPLVAVDVTDADDDPMADKRRKLQRRLTQVLVFTAYLSALGMWFGISILCGVLLRYGFANDLGSVRTAAKFGLGVSFAAIFTAIWVFITFNVLRGMYKRP